MGYLEDRSGAPLLARRLHEDAVQRLARNRNREEPALWSNRLNRVHRRQ